MRLFTQNIINFGIQSFHLHGNVKHSPATLSIILKIPSAVVLKRSSNNRNCLVGALHYVYSPTFHGSWEIIYRVNNPFKCCYLTAKHWKFYEKDLRTLNYFIENQGRIQVALDAGIACAKCPQKTCFAAHPRWPRVVISRQTIKLESRGQTITGPMRALILPDIENNCTNSLAMHMTSNELRWALPLGLNKLSKVSLGF